MLVRPNIVLNFEDLIVSCWLIECQRKAKDCVGSKAIGVLC